MDLLILAGLTAAYYLGTSNEYTSFQTRREYILSRLVKRSSFDGLK